MYELTSSAVMDRFLSRVRGDLVMNNVLRGAWVEEIVAAFLGIDNLPGQWNYYDMRAEDGRTISVKQSVGRAARFDVTGRANAWDNELAAQLRRADPKADGWLPNPAGLPRRWCDVYVFAHLADPVDAVRVGDIDAWRFAARSRAWLDELPVTAKTQSVSQLVERDATFVHGNDLGSQVASCLLA
jgi:hypothetical protein